MRTNFRIPVVITFSILADLRRPLLAQERGVIKADGVPSALTIQCYVVRICRFDCGLLLSTRSFTEREASRGIWESSRSRVSVQLSFRVSRRPHLRITLTNRLTTHWPLAGFAAPRPPADGRHVPIALLSAAVITHAHDSMWSYSGRPCAATHRSPAQTRPADLPRG